MKTSAKCPKGGPNDWPVEDYNAWSALLAAALEIMEKRAETASCSSDIQPEVAYPVAAGNIGLKGGKHHWLVDFCLTNHHGLFRCEYDNSRGLWYMRAASWLRGAPMASLANADLCKEAGRQVDEDLIPEYLTPQG